MIIYKITNKINGNIYIGRTKRNKKDLEKYFGSGKLITKAVKKYGKLNFKKDILEECQTWEEAGIREKFWIKTMNSFVPNGYNIGDGGEGQDTISKNPNRDIICKKISNTLITKETCKGKNNPMCGKFGKDNPNYQKKHRKDSHHKEGGKKLSKFIASIGGYKGKNNPRYGDHRNYTEIHGEEKAIFLKKLMSESRKGSGNSRAKRWKLINPTGKEFIVVGVLKEFCKQHNLSIGLLKDNIGKPAIAKIIHRRFEKMTKNTIGWTLYEL